MSELYVKQKFFSLAGKYNVLDKNKQPVYTIKGSFFKIPKSFTILDQFGNQVAKITHQPFHMLQTFTISINNKTVATIKKQLTLFKSKLTVDAGDIQVNGDLLGLNFSLKIDGKIIATIKESALSFAHYYEISVKNDQYEHISLAIMLAIDFAKEQSSAASSSSTN